MSNSKVLGIFFLTIILLLTATGTGFAQDGQPPKLPEVPFVPPIPPGRLPFDGDQFGKESQTFARAAADVSAQALTLGSTGLSFRYVQTLGTSNDPYLVDGTHLNGPNGLFIDSSNTLFVTEETGSRVLAYDPAGANTMTLGHAGQPWGHDDFLSNPKDVAKDAAGNIWIVFNYAALKEFDPTGTTVIQSYPATNNWEQGSTNDHFSDPRGIAFDAAGLMYISDGNNHRVQVYDVSGATPLYVTTIGVTGAPQSDNTGFNYPGQIAFDSLGRLYVVDTNNYRVQRCTFGVDWTCTTFFGVTGEPGSDLTHLDWANGITINGSNIFIADSANARVLKCTTSAVCARFAGTGVPGIGNTQLDWPADAAVDSSGNVFVSDVHNYRVQKFNSVGTYQSTIGITRIPYLTDNSHFNRPWGIAIASDNSMYILENSGYRLIKLNSSGVFQWSVGQAGIYGSDNAHLGSWWAGAEGSPAIDASGRVYVGDTGNDRVQIFNSDGSYSATLGSWGTGNYEFACPTDISISPVNGDIYVADHCNHRIQVFTSSRVYKATLGETGTLGSDNLHFNYPYGMTVDNSGNIFVADKDNHRVQKCQLIVSAPGYACSTFAGVSGVSGTDFAHLGSPLAVKVDASGRVYVAEEWNNRVQVFDANGAYLTTISGSWGTTNGDLISPSGLVLDSSGNVYVTDRDNHRIQKFAPGTPGWMQSNLNGFGDMANRINSLESFGNQLYAGAYNFGGNGAQLWRSSDGKNWSALITDGFGDATNVGIDHLIEFDGKYYAGTWNSTDTGTNGGQIWRSTNGTVWEQVVNNGFGDPTNSEVFQFAVFNNNIYASTWSSSDLHGAEIWRSGTGNAGEWTKVVSNGFGNATNLTVSTMEVFNGYLYAGTYSWDNATDRPDGCEVWRTANGSDWTVVTDGFGNLDCWNIFSLTTFGDSLYAGTGIWDANTQSSPGGQIWRCTIASGCDETSDWAQVNTDGFGNPQNETVSSLRVLGSQLYAVSENYSTGLGVWKTGNGTNWQQVGFAGFGDSNNTTTYYNNSVTVFNNSLFIGTTNWANGGEIWSRTPPVEAYIGGTLRGSYFLTPGQSTRQNYAGLDSGPVKVESTNSVPIISAIRSAWAVNGVTTSFSQLMGLPLEQLSDTYVFPGYNNVTLNDQLRIANVDTLPTSVTVTIGGTLRGTYPLAAGAAVRINYPGLDSGPVVVKGTSGVKIISSIREAWAVNGVTKSFVQLMGLPAGQLSNKYVFPGYNNVTLNEQLRIGNVDTVSTSVTVTIGGNLKGTYLLGPGQAVRINYPGLDSGPVVVEGTAGVNIISAIRSAWAVNGVTTSFSQLMGMPAGQLSDKYLFPGYNNVTLNDQLRIANVDTVPTTVTVTIGGNLKGTYPLAAGAAVRINYPGLDSGPVVVQGTSGVKIISSIREAWAVNGVTQSFVQLMGLPSGQLSTTYFFPGYNNVTLNEQLRIGMP